jgi:MEMO1 family protein
MKRLLIRLAAAALMLGPSLEATPASTAAPMVRAPAVAGIFYPANSAALGTAVDQYLAAAKTQRTGELRALICPHAGYAYSGPVAGSGFRLLQGLHFDTVILLGPAHYAWLDRGSVSDAALFRTPLGDVPVSAKARQLALAPPFALNPRCRVEPPEWADPTRSRGIALDQSADTWEHSDEVEVPFLQRTLGRFELVPVVMGEVDPAAAARALAPLIDDRTLLVVSSDLSHYHSYADAERLDRSCVDAILALDVRKMETQEACGRVPILTLLHLAQARGWRPQLLDLRNSGDTAGDKSRVVGYAAIAFYAPTVDGSPLSAADRQELLTLARDSVRAAATTGKLPPVALDQADAALKTPRGVFVTLTKRGELRGCIGHLQPQWPLLRAVAEDARSAALEDPRFGPVTANEVGELEIEISVLTEPKPLSFVSPDDLLKKLHPREDGVVLRIAAGTATYLPQVWDQLPDEVEFLDTLAEKAGGRAGDWRKPGTQVAVYRVDSFKEASP